MLLFLHKIALSVAASVAYLLMLLVVLLLILASSDTASFLIVTIAKLLFLFFATADRPSVYSLVAILFYFLYLGCH